MKVVLFCGGQGLRIQDNVERLPKPMVPVGGRPILWHVMRYYAHFRHREFVLCLGHAGEVIERWVDALAREQPDWSITCARTGATASVGMRLRAVRPLLGDDPLFLASYSDGVTDAPLEEVVALVERRPSCAGAFLAVPPSQSFHVVRVAPDHRVEGLDAVRDTGLLINGGFMVLRPAVFDAFEDGEDLIPHCFERLMAERRLAAYPYRGFWACMDTVKEQQHLSALWADGAPWAIWRRALPEAGTSLPGLPEAA